LGNASITVRLVGTKSNRDAIGARIRIEACGGSQFKTVRNGGSYLSVDDPRAHFGLGTCAKVDELRIRWPGGRLQIQKNLSVDRYLTVEEPF